MEMTLSWFQGVMWKFVLFVALLCCGSEVSGISCKNEAGVDVDWYILYKPPNIKDVYNGYRYYYIDLNTVNVPKPKLHNKPINAEDGVLAKTLEPYFNWKPGTTDTGYIAYNDHPPKEHASSNCGHSKGLVMMDTNSGFWLLHSTPKFPNSRKKVDFFPDSGDTNGQTFICVTFPYATFEDIGEHLQYIKAHIFEKHIPNKFHQSLQDAANNQRRDPNTLQKLYFDLYKHGQVEFKSFVSKVSENEDGDLYVTIADNFKSDVDVQTWGRQRGRSDDNTSNRYHVLNVECIGIESTLWEPTKDHSKWSVSKDWTCIADSNRAVSQFNRPGGALCINNKKVTDLFTSFIKDKNDCPKKPRPSTSH